MDFHGMVEAFKALSSEKRVEIVRLLCERRRMCAGSIAREMEISPSSASQHLRVLRQAGLVNDCRCGNRIHYSISRENASALSRMTDDLLDISEIEEECGKIRECEQKKRGG